VGFELVDEDDCILACVLGVVGDDADVNREAVLLVILVHFSLDDGDLGGGDQVDFLEGQCLQALSDLTQFSDDLLLVQNEGLV